MFALIVTTQLFGPPLPKSKIVEFRIEGVSRRAAVVEPEGNSGPMPLILVFHGHGGNIRTTLRQFNIHSLWPQALIVYPEGLPAVGINDPDGKKNGWQKNPGELGDRDLKFTDAILKQMRADYRIDNKRIYAMGHSNGARFTYVLWAERGETFAAYNAACSPAGLLVQKMSPASAFIVAGKSDPIVPFASQKLTIESVAKLDRVREPGRDSGYFHFAEGPGGLELATYVHPGGHSYPREAMSMAIEFFKRHSK